MTLLLALAILAAVIVGAWLVLFLAPYLVAALVIVAAYARAAWVWVWAKGKRRP